MQQMYLEKQAQRRYLTDRAVWVTGFMSGIMLVVALTRPVLVPKENTVPDSH